MPGQFLGCLGQPGGEDGGGPDTCFPPPRPQLACGCYALLPALGRGFSQGLRHTECWNQEVQGLLATLHGLLGALFEGSETGEWGAGEGTEGPRGGFWGLRGQGQTLRCGFGGLWVTERARGVVFRAVGL